MFLNSFLPGLHQLARFQAQVLEPHNFVSLQYSIKIQPDATVCSYLFTAKSLYMFRVSQHPLSGVVKTVIAASGTGHNIRTATSLLRGQIGRFCSKINRTAYCCIYLDYYLILNYDAQNHELIICIPCYTRDTQIFQRTMSNLTILGTRRFTKSKFDAEDPQI